MRKVLWFSILIILAISHSCSIWDKDDGIVRINYGTSFGECIGFCNNALTIMSDSILYKSQSWYPLIQVKTQRGSINPTQWKYYKEELNVEYFLDLPPIIGCPDCTDGGAEWLEIELSNGDKHKVTFEYMNEPSKLHAYILSLRDLMSNRIYITN